MSAYNLIDLQTVLRKIGRGTVFFNVTAEGGTTPVYDRWDNASELHLAQLGDTEGDIVFNPNDDTATLTLPEISGQAIYEATHVGEGPTLTIPLFVADPDLLPIISPTGTSSGGFTRVREVTEHTIVIFPENLFRVEGSPADTYEELAHSGGAWTLNGSALSASKQTLLGLSIWAWRGYFTKPERSLLGGHGDAGKNIVEVQFNLMMHPDMPEGHRLYTIGDPDDVTGIDIDGGS